VWGAATLIGLLVTGWAVHAGVRLGTSGAPFLGHYRLRLSPMTPLAVAIAAAVVLLAVRGIFLRAAWWQVQLVSYGAALAWALALALVDGWAGLTRTLRDPDNYGADVAAVGEHPGAYLRHYVTDPASHSSAARGHPPGPVLTLWLLHRLGIDSHLGLALLITVIGAAVVPLVLSAVHGVSGAPTARRYAPVLILAPYAVWVAVSADVFVAVLGAAHIACAVRGSAPGRRGWRAIGWTLLAGLLIGLAALYSYSAAWLGLSAVCLYFARRRPFLNLTTGLGALVPVLAADRLGFAWLSGLQMAHTDFQTRVQPARPVLWWAVISVAALLVAAGPALVASARKVRNTDGWSFLVGSACAVVFSIGAGLARGGVETAWLAFFPWLTVAVVAPEVQGGDPPPTPALLAGAGAVVAIVVEALLVTPW
jgi:methylthioxylose transferase